MKTISSNGQEDLEYVNDVEVKDVFKEANSVAMFTDNNLRWEHAMFLPTVGCNHGISILNRLNTIDT